MYRLDMQKILSSLLMLWACLPSLYALGGGDVDPVLMRVGCCEVTRSEFEYYYNRAVRQTIGGLSPKAYARSFTDFKLKVQAAEAAGLDTIPAFRDEMAAYRARMSVEWLTDSAALDRALRRRYARLVAAGPAVRVEQVCRRLPQNVTGAALRAAVVQMDSIYEALCQAGPEAFGDFVRRFSDDDSVRWVRRLEVTAEFADTVFALKPGAWSRPFFTPRGLHIVRVLGRAEVPPFEAVRDSLLHSSPRCVEEAARIWADRRKAAYGYEASGRLTDRQVRQILVAEYDRLEREIPAYRLALQSYREEALARAADRLEATRLAVANEQALQDYFHRHRSDYHWETPRFRGIVLHCAGKRVAKRARKMLKHLPETEWSNAVRLMFNKEEVQIQAEQGTFAPGDNAVVDERIFKQGEAPEVKGFPYTVLLGKKQKGPSDYREVRPALLADYRAAHEGQWLAALRADSKVEINQEVLKTVNNH